MGQEPDFKSHLASEICSISTQIVTCIHRHYYTPINSSFIDWYRLLGVEEDAGIDVIRKKYLKLVLQLHPDKNTDPKAEVAFKLVSEGYACLSENAKREAFDLERKKKFCPHCNTIPYRNPNSLRKFNGFNVLGAYKNTHHGGLRDIRERFKEEATVIGNCLRTSNYATTRETSLFNPPPDCLFKRFQQRNLKETPIFNPSDYVCQGYPHFQTRIEPKLPQSFRCFRTGNTLKYEQASRRFEHPVFEIRSESFVLQKKSSFAYSKSLTK